EWTINNFSNQNARYVKLFIIGNNENEWATLWEAQIYGSITDYVTTNVDEKQTIPVKYSLSQNYPNPFNPNTKINFTLAEAGKVSLEVYNILGEKVSTLLNEEISAGQHEVNFNASNLASGVYIYRLNVNNKFTDTKKMILMK
ncbi:MAG: T9SS type A sorting domain-containing protein, partial [Ignavibacteriaceae bacterium]